LEIGASCFGVGIARKDGFPEQPLTDGADALETVIVPVTTFWFAETLPATVKSAVPSPAG
jgi:hypothetical protein